MESLLTPYTGIYTQLLDGHPGDTVLSGVGIYFDMLMLRPVCSILAWDKSFVKSHTMDKRNIGNACPSNFTRQYSFHEPSNLMFGGWSSTFANLVSCIGIVIKKDTNHDCLL